MCTIKVTYHLQAKLDVESTWPKIDLEIVNIIFKIL